MWWGCSGAGPAGYRQSDDRGAGCGGRGLHLAGWQGGTRSACAPHAQHSKHCKTPACLPPCPALPAADGTVLDLLTTLRKDNTGWVHGCPAPPAACLRPAGQRDARSCAVRIACAEVVHTARVGGAGTTSSSSSSAARAPWVSSRRSPSTARPAPRQVGAQRRPWPRALPVCCCQPGRGRAWARFGQ